MEVGMQKDKELQQQLYTVAFVDLSIKNILDSSYLFARPEWLDTLFLLVFFGCIGWKLLLQKFTLKTLVATIAFGSIFAYISIHMKYFFLLFSYCGIIGIQNVDLKRVLRYTSITKFIMILIHVIPYIVCLLITPEEIDYVYRNGVQRHYFYIGHPNTFSMYVGWALLEFTYAFYESLSNFCLVAFWFINLLVYHFTDSNTSIIVATVSYSLFLLERYNPKMIAKYITPVARYLYMVLAIFFTVITVWFSSMPAAIRSMYLTLNDVMTGRLLFGSFAYDKFGIAWLGNPNVYLATTTYYQGFWVDTLVFDNTYIYLLVYYGAIALPIISAAFVLIGKDKKKDIGRNVTKILIIAYALFAIMENYANNAVLCFPLLFIGERMYQLYEEKMKIRRNKREETCVSS